MPVERTLSSKQLLCSNCDLYCSVVIYTVQHDSLKPTTAADSDDLVPSSLSRIGTKGYHGHTHIDTSEIEPCKQQKVTHSAVCQLRSGLVTAAQQQPEVSVVIFNKVN